MWIVQLALRRPYTFVMMALLILVMGAWFIIQTPKDIFPSVDIPVVNVIWSYKGLPAEEFEQRITTFSEFSLSKNINDIERIESQTLDGIAIIRLFFHPNVNLESAISQVTASSQSVLRHMPKGVEPPIIVKYTASSVPILQILLSSDTLNESELYDYGIYRIRQSIAAIQGVTIPSPYGGTARQLMIDLDPEALQARGISPGEINNAINDQNLISPTGDSRIGTLDYRVNMNNTPILANDFNDIPIKVVNDVVIYLRDVGFAHDGFIPQTSIVRNNGKRAVLLMILKTGSASTLEVVNSIKKILPTLRAAAPKGMNIDLLFDQSVFVRSSIKSVMVEGVLASVLTGAIILIFLASWRSTLIVFVSIPLSVLSSIIMLSLIGETLNVMTLGGLALAIGILVDDATVTLENIHRNIQMEKTVRQGILDGSAQIIFPALVTMLSICIVFLPVVMLVGPAKFLFTPLALAVVFAIATSFFISRTLVPTMIDYLIQDAAHTTVGHYQENFDKKFHRFRSYYTHLLHWILTNRATGLILFGLVFVSAIVVFPFVGKDFFPVSDAGQLRLHVQAATGTRIEVTEEIFGEVEEAIKKIIPHNEIAFLIDNIGLVSEPYNYAFGDNATLGTYDGEILISFNNDRKMSTTEYMAILRNELKKQFPHLRFFFQPADMTSQILHFGLPAPIDVRVVGHDTKNNLNIANELVESISHIPGSVDVHLHQVNDFPELFLNVDRTLLARAGLTQKKISDDVLISYSSSSEVSPNFWLDRETGIPYLISIQTPKYKINTADALMRMPVSTPQIESGQLLSNLAQLEHRETIGVANHFNVQPVYDIYANVQGRDLGGVASDIYRIIDEKKGKLAPGNEIAVRGIVKDMNEAFIRLALGFIFAFILVYSLLVVNFQSWTDPFIIIMALPGAIVGIAWMLYLTNTTFNVPSLMGMIMSVGLATANSILLVSFANTLLIEGKNSLDAILEAASIRLRPILMTAMAMIVGMTPMALGFGEGGEQNAPLGRAVIGGLCFATVTTLFFVPIIFTFLRQKPNLYLVGPKKEGQIYVHKIHHIWRKNNGTNK